MRFPLLLLIQSLLSSMSEPDTTLRAVELSATIGSVKRLQDGSVSLYVKSNLEFTKAQAWPFSLLQGECATVLIQPDNIGDDADTVRPQGKRGGSASQIQRLLIEEIAKARGVAADKIEAYYQSRMASNQARLEKELAQAQKQEF